MAYNIRLSTSIFMGNCSTKTKDEIEIIDYHIQDRQLKIIYWHCIIHILQYKKYVMFWRLPERWYQWKIEQCVEQQYIFDLNDLCLERLDEDDPNSHYAENVDYPRSKISMYSKNLDTPLYYGYQIGLTNANKYNKSCSDLLDSD